MISGNNISGNIHKSKPVIKKPPKYSIENSDIIIKKCDEILIQSNALKEKYSKGVIDTIIKEAGNILVLTKNVHITRLARIIRLEAHKLRRNYTIDRIYTIKESAKKIKELII